jgi:hypothetical protein
MIFLNKSDLFREKIQHKDLKVLFEDYTGTRRTAHAVQHYIFIFVTISQQEGRILMPVSNTSWPS